MLAIALEDDLWDTVMVRYGILNFTAEEEVFPQAIERQAGVLSMASVRHNLVTQAGLEAVVRAAKSEGVIGQNAIEDTNHAERLSPDETIFSDERAQIRIDLGLILTSEGRYGEARPFLEDGIREMRTHLVDNPTAGAGDTVFGIRRIMVARAFCALGRHEEARENYSAAATHGCS